MGKEELEMKIKLVFEGTGLVTNVQVKGRLYDEGNPLRLEHKIKERPNGEAESLAILRLFKRNLVRKLLSNYSIIKEILGKYYKSGFCIERIVINQEAPKPDENKTRDSILQTIEKELENYAMQIRH